MTKPAVSAFRYFNSSPEVIRLVVMIYVHYPPSLRNVEDLLFERAVDHEGEILESYVTKKRDKKAALAFMKKALKRHGSPAKIVTDGLRSYPAAMRDLGKQQEMGQWLNNRVENSHLSFRRRDQLCSGSDRCDPAEIRIHPRPLSQSLRPGAPSRRSRDLQAKTLGRLGPVAVSRELSVPVPSPKSIVWRAVRLCLTAPSGGTGRDQARVRTLVRIDRTRSA